MAVVAVERQLLIHKQLHGATKLLGCVARKVTVPQCGAVSDVLQNNSSPSFLPGCVVLKYTVAYGNFLGSRDMDSARPKGSIVHEPGIAYFKRLHTIIHHKIRPF